MEPERAALGIIRLANLKVASTVRRQTLEKRREITDFGHDKAFADSILPLVYAGVMDLVELGDVIAGCLTLEAAPGHSPGQIVIRAESDGEVGIIAADVIHLPIQLTFPDAGSVACVDAEASRLTRRALLSGCAANGHLLLTNHFSAPSACRIVQVGDHFALSGADDE